MLLLFCQVEAQKGSTPQLPTFHNTDPNALPHLITKEKPIGSPYLTKNWVTGYIELENHHHIPDSNEYVLMNFDKIQSVIYLTNGVDKIWFYTIDSIKSFELFDINKAYDFEKIPWISSKFYLIPVIKSAKGYSLYKRLVTTFSWATIHQMDIHPRAKTTMNLMIPTFTIWPILEIQVLKNLRLEKIQFEKI